MKDTYQCPVSTLEKHLFYIKQNMLKCLNVRITNHERRL